MNTKSQLYDIVLDECYDYRYCQILEKFTLGPNIQYCGFINDCENHKHDVNEDKEDSDSHEHHP